MRNLGKTKGEATKIMDDVAPREGLNGKTHEECLQKAKESIDIATIAPNFPYTV